MPNLKAPCGKCGRETRHERDCPEKRSSSPRSWTRERLAALVRGLGDEAFGVLVSIVAGEAADRTSRIEEDAARRIAAIRAILPVAPLAPPSSIAGRGIGLPSHEAPPTPKVLQCPAICPENVELKCSQPRDHEGQHFNREAKRSWQRR